jgi:hypothetical protein
MISARRSIPAVAVILALVMLAIFHPWQADAGAATSTQTFPSPGAYVLVLDVQVEASSCSEVFNVDASWDGIFYRATLSDGSEASMGLMRPDGVMQNSHKFAGEGETSASSFISLQPGSLAESGIVDANGSWKVVGSLPYGLLHIQVFKVTMP